MRGSGRENIQYDSKTFNEKDLYNKTVKNKVKYVNLFWNKRRHFASNGSEGEITVLSKNVCKLLVESNTEELFFLNPI